MATIKYSGSLKEIVEAAKDQLCKILDVCGIAEAIITSTTRTPHDQARIMFGNLEKYGVEAQRKLYKPAGQQIIDVYEHAKAQGMKSDAVLTAMESKVNEIGPEKISAHCTNDPTKSVFDVAPSSIPPIKKTLFEMHVQDCVSVKKFLMPPTDPAYHIEMSFPVQGQNA